MDQLDRALWCGRHADVGVMGILKRNRTPADPDLELIAAQERAVLAFAEERIASAGSPPDGAQRTRDEAATLAATIGERLRAELQQNRNRQL